MEGGNTDMAGPVGTTGNSRWNPTKEQISMLESLYRQGIRTPSAVQIQQITNRLKAYGSIESKNVFYWFQNHKARQRQKQKPENMAHINRYLHGTQLVYPPPPRPNAAYGPYFRLPGDSWGKVLIPGGIKSIRRPQRFTVGAAHGLVHQGCSNNMLPDIENYKGILNNGNPETLDLFPLHATGVSDGRGTLMSPFGSTTSAGNPTITPSSSCETIPGTDQECLGGEQHFFDFFSCPGSSKSD